ncbi:MAG TPA: CBS domain-containing protein [Pirellulaceae bacterium]|nr:CBS domain-containing protein [Pirellulaceae bacterium]
MTKNPIRIESGASTAEAMELLAAHNISELPVVDIASRPIGLIDITDVVGF